MAPKFNVDFQLQSTINQPIDARITGFPPPPEQCYPGLIRYEESANEFQFWDPVALQFSPLVTGNAASTDISTEPFAMPDGIGALVDGVLPPNTTFNDPLPNATKIVIFKADVSSHVQTTEKAPYVLHLHMHMDDFAGLVEPGKYHLDVEVYYSTSPTGYLNPAGDTLVASSTLVRGTGTVSMLHERTDTGSYFCYYVCATADDGGTTNHDTNTATGFTGGKLTNASYFKVVRLPTKADATRTLATSLYAMPNDVGIVLSGTYTPDTTVAPGHLTAPLPNAQPFTIFNILVDPHMLTGSATYMLNFHAHMSGDRFIGDNNAHIFEPSKYSLDVAIKSTVNGVPDPFNDPTVANTTVNWRDATLQTSLSAVHVRTTSGSYYVVVTPDDGGEANRATQTLEVQRALSTQSYFTATRLVAGDVQRLAEYPAAAPGIGEKIVATSITLEAPHDVQVTLLQTDNITAGLGRPYLIELKLTIAPTTGLIDKRYPQGTYEILLGTTVINSGALQSVTTDVSFVHHVDGGRCSVRVTMDNGGMANQVQLVVTNGVLIMAPTTFTTDSSLTLTRLLSTGTVAAPGADITPITLDTTAPTTLTVPYGITPSMRFGSAGLNGRYPIVNQVGLLYTFSPAHVGNMWGTTTDNGFSEVHGQTGPASFTGPNLPPNLPATARTTYGDPPSDVDHNNVLRSIEIGQPNNMHSPTYTHVAQRPIELYCKGRSGGTHVWHGYFRNRDDDGNQIYGAIQFRLESRFCNTYLFFNDCLYLNQNRLRLGHLHFFPGMVVDTTVEIDLDAGQEMFPFTLIVSHLNNHLAGDEAWGPDPSVNQHGTQLMNLTYRLRYLPQYRAAQVSRPYFDAYFGQFPETQAVKDAEEATYQAAYDASFREVPIISITIPIIAGEGADASGSSVDPDATTLVATLPAPIFQVDGTVHDSSLNMALDTTPAAVADPAFSTRSWLFPPNARKPNGELMDENDPETFLSYEGPFYCLATGWQPTHLDAVLTHLGQDAATHNYSGATF